jgi:tetratricopeptide (TPR) repeat protein
MKTIIIFLLTFSLGYSQKVKDSEINELETLFQDSQFEKLFEKSQYLKINRKESEKIDLYLGLAYATKKNCVESSKLLEAVIKKEPKNLTALSFLSQCYTNLGLHEKAIPILTKTIQLGNTYSFLLRGISYLRTDNVDLAINDLEYFESLENENKNIPTLYYYQANAYIEKGSGMRLNHDLNYKKYYNLAIKSLKKAISLEPENYIYYRDLGFVYMLEDDFDKARMNFIKSLEINEDQIDTSNYLKQTNKVDSSNKITLRKESGVYLIPATLYNAVTVDFIFDSGASEVLISPEIVGILMKKKLILQSDILEDGYFEIADGSILKLKRFLIREFKIGNHTLRNVECTIAKDLFTDMLLGQSVLSKLGKYSFDYTNLVLEIGN